MIEKNIMVKLRRTLIESERIIKNLNNTLENFNGCLRDLAKWARENLSEKEKEKAKTRGESLGDGKGK